MNLVGGADRKFHMKTLPTRIRLHVPDTNVYNVSTMMPRIPEAGKTCPVILAENFRCGQGVTQRTRRVKAVAKRLWSRADIPPEVVGAPHQF